MTWILLWIVIDANFGAEVSGTVEFRTEARCREAQAELREDGSRLENVRILAYCWETGA